MVVIAVLLAAVVGTNLWLTRNLFAHIREPLAALMQGIHHIQNGDLNAPIAYTKNDEFRPARSPWPSSSGSSRKSRS